MKQKKIMILIIAAVIIIAIIAIVVAMNSSKDNDNEKNEQGYVKELEDGTKVNTSEKLAETKTYNGLEFTNIEFTSAASVTNLHAEVKNTTENDMKAQIVDVEVLDEAGNVLTTFIGSIDALKAGETTEINAAIAANYANAYNINIVAPQ